VKVYPENVELKPKETPFECHNEIVLKGINLPVKE